jgi:hypothetical protein
MESSVIDPGDGAGLEDVAEGAGVAAGAGLGAGDGGGADEGGTCA